MKLSFEDKVPFSKTETFVVGEERRDVAMDMKEQWQSEGKHVVVSEDRGIITVTYTEVGFLRKKDAE